MTTLPSYKTQFNKITEAYIKDEIRPMDRSFCFCGTLENGDYKWIDEKTAIGLTYTYQEYSRMEDALLNELTDFHVYKIGDDGWHGNACPELSNPAEYEPALFKGMCNALEVLKQIHIEKGEVIDDTPQFKKRQLATI